MSEIVDNVLAVAGMLIAGAVVGWHFGEWWGVGGGLLVALAALYVMFFAE